ncbi:hypothetical protein GR158_16760 [Shinella sp. AETb1-6]|uniref:hypothetical protein n=1 Tax=Shinella sp. AETb1-6 TaxID=2692210 RepID=UPI00141D609C|nr:hypothetical protein [Shinella sp. AETb1-6]MXN52773.1 hypothetical protein [Shinella sp. AETb1-6]WLS11732.1 hypothetical protein Q9314_24745 [Shinella sumterensis]
MFSSIALVEPLGRDLEIETGLERGEAFDGGNEAVLLGDRDDAFGQRPELVDVVRTLERAHAPRGLMAKR